MRKRLTDVNTDVNTEEETVERKDEENLCISSVNLSLEDANANKQRKRLSVIDTKMKLRASSTNSRPMSLSLSDIRDPGEDIGNGAYGENSRHEMLPLIYSCVTRPGNDPAKRQKENQDTYCVHNELGTDARSFTVCVFDGHGPNGHLASSYVREKLPKAWIDMGLGRPSCQSEEEIKRIMHNGCVEINHSLSSSRINVYVSGSTGILGVFKENILYCANVGDSRAVIGRADKNGKMYAFDISDDQKPDRPDEMARIIRYGGRVFDWGVSRVWRKDVDMPGLAMARSFGDQAAESVGVFAEPEISRTELSSQDKFAIFATDGVWEFLSSNDVVKIIAEHLACKSPEQAARDAAVEVINKSVAQWNREEDVVDDCTCVIIALDFP